MAHRISKIPYIEIQCEINGTLEIATSKFSKSFKIPKFLDAKITARSTKNPKTSSKLIKLFDQYYPIITNNIYIFLPNFYLFFSNRFPQFLSISIKIIRPISSINDKIKTKQSRIFNFYLALNKKKKKRNQVTRIETNPRLILTNAYTRLNCTRPNWLRQSKLPELARMGAGLGSRRVHVRERAEEHVKEVGLRRGSS